MTGGTFVVVGAGVTGLAAAHHLLETAPGAHVVVYEGSERVGGKIRTDRFAGAAFEAGPDWFVTRSPAALELCTELGLDGALVAPTAPGTLVWSGGRLRRLPHGTLRGVPPSPWRALRAGLLSPAAAARALADYVLPGPLRGPDVAAGRLLRRRLGRAVLDRLVEPMLAASRAGRPDELSLAAAAPELDALARAHRSLMRAVRAAAPGGARVPFLGLAGGMEGLVHALVGAIRYAEIHTAAPVRRIEPSPRGLRVHPQGRAPVEADGVVLAVPAFAAADIVEEARPGAAAALRSIPYASAVVVGLRYPAGGGRPPRGSSGMLVPAAERRTITACAWFSEKWAHARPPDGSLIVRAFVGRFPGDPALEADDRTLVERVADDIEAATGIVGHAETHVVRWRAALPVYRVGHPALVARIRGEADLPGLVLAGAAYDGSGLPDCISQGRRAAEALTRPS